MPFPSLVCAVIETTLNQLLQLDSSAEQRLPPLTGKAIKLTLQEYKQPLHFFFSNQRVEVLAEYEGTLDAELTIAATTLPQLKQSGQITELIKSEQLVIVGDIKLLQHFADLMIKLNIDWEEHLSHYTGDIIAHRSSQFGSKVWSKLSKLQQQNKKQVAEYITQELRLAPGRLEFVHFSDQVNQLNKQLNQLEQRIKQLN